MTDKADMRGNVPIQDVDYLVFSIKEIVLALPYYDIVQIIDSPVCTSVPNMPHYLRGVINLMGEALPLIDTRVILSIQSRQEEVREFVQTFMMRKQDHLNWIDKLKHAVDRGEDITVERNPHKCSFGRWYDTFTPNTLALATYMSQFDAPHKAIHRLADKAEELLEDGQKERAQVLIHAAESSELVKLVKLFDGFEEKMRQSYQEYAIVVTHKDRKYALTADTLKYFEKLDEIVTYVPFGLNIDNKVVAGIGKKTMGDATDNIIIILNLEGFLGLNM